jgi:hypothetical protein
MAYVPKLSEQIVAEKEGREGPIEKEYREKLQSQVDAASGGFSPEYSGMIAPMSQEQLRIAQEQQRLAEALRAQAEGRTPSLAQMQFQRALEGSQAAIQSQLASARGLSPAQAQRIAARQQAALGANAAGQSAEMRLREQMAAQAALANLLAQSRQGALGGYQTSAELAARERALRAELASGIQTRDFQRNQQITQGVLNMLPFVGQGLAKIANSQSPSQSSFDANSFYDRSDVQSAFDKLPSESGFSGSWSQEQNDAFSRLAHGSEVPGRAKYRGDTRSNDTVPAMLSPGEIVLPRSVAQSPNAPDKAKQFVEAIKTKKKPSPKDYTQALMRLHELEARMDAMESLADIKAEEE